jgi:hypothetical protein
VTYVGTSDDAKSLFYQERVASHGPQSGIFEGGANFLAWRRYSLGVNTSTILREDIRVGHRLECKTCVCSKWRESASPMSDAFAPTRFAADTLAAYQRWGPFLPAGRA